MLAAGGFGDHGELHLARPRPADLRAEHTEKGALSGGHGHTEIEKARGIRADGRKFAGELGELAHPADKGLEATATKPSGVTHFSPMKRRWDAARIVPLASAKPIHA